MSEDHDVSAPPPSPTPPPPEFPKRQQTLSGWHPADDDDSPKAVAWRARTALRRADRGLVAVTALSASVEKLDATINAAEEKIDKFVKSVIRTLKWAGAIVGTLALAGSTHWVWTWVSSLHH